MPRTVELPLAGPMLTMLDNAGLKTNLATMRIVTALNISRTVTAEQMISIVTTQIPLNQLVAYDINDWRRRIMTIVNALVHDDELFNREVRIALHEYEDLTVRSSATPTETRNAMSITNVGSWLHVRLTEIVLALLAITCFGGAAYCLLETSDGEFASEWLVLSGYFFLRSVGKANLRRRFWPASNASTSNDAATPAAMPTSVEN